MQEEAQKKLLLNNEKSTYKKHSNKKWKLLLTQKVEDQEYQMMVTLLNELFKMKMHSPKLQE